MDVIKRNFKGLYLFSLVNVLFFAFGLFFYESSYFGGILGIIYLIFFAVIYAGFQWYILNICRNNENEHIFKTIAANSGWIIIVSIVKNIVMYMLLIAVSIILGFVWGAVRQTGIFEDILERYIRGMVTALFVFTEFIYYDKKDRGPLRAVFDSIKTTRKVYGKVFFVYLFIFLYDIILLILAETAKENMRFRYILFISAFVWRFAVYPLCYVKLCKIYNSVKKEESEINDSLTVVARALDDEMNKN